MQTWGSHGDIRPFLALAEGLQAAGHEVTLLITCVDSPAYEGMVSPLGVKIRVIASPVLDPERAEAVGRTVYSTRNPMTQIVDILRLCFDPVEEAMFQAAQALSAESDLLIGHYFMFPLQVAAEQAGRPYISVLLSHSAVPSEFNHPFGWQWVGKTGNRFLWWLTKAALNKALLHYPNRLRSRCGMPQASDVVTEAWLSRRLTLVAISAQICERQPDWPSTTQVCGFLDMPNLELEGQLPESLAAFLAAGDAPVYMTFGSWMPKDLPNQRDTLGILTEAARLAGCRAIIQGPNWRECGFASGAQFLYVDAAPHHRIFPHCRAIVHHGGAGTTQSSTLAGAPSVVIPHISEQEHWGRELRRMGLAGSPIKRRGLTPDKLAGRLRSVLGRPQMRTKAELVASAMASENGVALAVRLIDQAFGARD
jgi:UDP:flavonoid glycosyltransferase YjiC (YdhE family)